MKRFFAWFLKRLRPAAPPVEAAIADVAPPSPECGPAVGSVYSFRTRPFTEFSAPATLRYAAFKVIGADGKVIAIGVLDAVWPAPPTVLDARAASILIEHRFSRRPKPAVFGVFPEWWTPEADLDALEFVGILPVTSTEQTLAAAVISGAVGVSYSTLHSADAAAEGEWRWAHDRDAFVAENDQRHAAQEAARDARVEAKRRRLRQLTWDQLLSETPFANWTPSPPYPPAAFTAAARMTIHDACRALKRLGPSADVASVRMILRQAVVWFNQADIEAGGVIETEERDDIFTALEELAHVAGHAKLADDIDAWRDW